MNVHYIRDSENHCYWRRPFDEAPQLTDVLLHIPDSVRPPAMFLESDVRKLPDRNGQYLTAALQVTLRVWKPV